MQSTLLLLRKNMPRWYWWMIHYVFSSMYTALLLIFRYQELPRTVSEIRYQQWDIFNCKQVR